MPQHRYGAVRVCPVQICKLANFDAGTPFCQNSIRTPQVNALLVKFVLPRTTL